jgi:hypothetical protein
MRIIRPLPGRKIGKSPSSIQRRTVLVETAQCLATSATERSTGNWLGRLSFILASHRFLSHCRAALRANAWTKAMSVGLGQARHWDSVSRKQHAIFPSQCRGAVKFLFAVASVLWRRSGQANVPMQSGLLASDLWTCLQLDHRIHDCLTRLRLGSGSESSSVVGVHSCAVGTRISHMP